MCGKHKHSKLKPYVLQKMLEMELMFQVSVMNKFEENNVKKFKLYLTLVILKINFWLLVKLLSVKNIRKPWKHLMKIVNNDF